MSSSSKTQSALRAALKQEDAAVAERLPVVAEAAAAAPAEIAVPEKAPLEAVVAPVESKVVAAKDAAATKRQAPKKSAARTAAPKKVASPPDAAKPAAAKAAATKPAVKVAAAKSSAKAAAPKAGVAKAAVVEPPPLPVVMPPKAEPVAKDAARKDKREKVVRDSFSMPKSEHAQIKFLRTVLAKSGRLATKSEVLRAALQLLAARSERELLALVEALPAVPKGKGKK